MTKKTQLDEITLKARVAKKLLDRLDSKLDKRQIELLGGLVDINNPEHREKLRNDDQYRRLNSVYTAAWFAKEKVPYRPYSKDKKLNEGTLGIPSKREAARSMAKRTFNSSVDPSVEYATLGAIGAGIGALGGPATAAIGGALGMGVVKVAKETDISRLAKNLKREPGIRTTEAKMRRREKVQELGDEAHQADKKSAWWAGLAAQVRKRVGWGGNTSAGRSVQAIALDKSNKWYKKGQKARDLKDKIGGLADKYPPGTYFEEFVESVKQLAEAKGISNREALKEMVLSEGLLIR